MGIGGTRGAVTVREGVVPVTGPVMPVMSDNLFSINMEERKNAFDDLGTPKEIREDFDEDLKKFAEDFSTGAKFVEALSLSDTFCRRIVEKSLFKTLPNVFKRLTEQLFKDHLGQMDNPTKYGTNSTGFFSADDMAYRHLFGISHKNLFKRLEAIGSDEMEVRKYWETFLSASTLFCAVGGYKLLFKDGVAVVERLDKGEEAKGLRREYYFFYNRSHVKLHGIGVGELTLVNEHSVDIAYYYSPTDKTPKGKKYATLHTTGKVERHPDARILLLKEVQDDDSYPETKVFSKVKPVLSSFVIKRYGTANEKLLLGVHTSWNRDDFFPYATAFVLIEKSVYDEDFPAGHPSAFEKIRDERSAHLIEREKSIPPAIFYYLYHMSINLNAAIEGNKGPGQKKSAVAFSTLDQLPYCFEESSHLPQLAGKYKGLTIVPEQGGQLVVLSVMEIWPNGMVFLRISRKTEEPGGVDSPGFVKYLTMDENGRGKLYINLRYDYNKSFNSLNYFLDFEEARVKGKHDRVRILRGGYAGESLITHQPIGASIVFEQMKEDTGFTVLEEPMFLEGGKEFNPRVRELAAAHPNLFNYYANGRSDDFSNFAGIELLRKEFARPTGRPGAKDNQYDVFISLPLTHRNDAKEYGRNARLANAVRVGLMEKFGFKRERIFCSCLDPKADKPLGFASYAKAVEKNNHVHGYGYIEEILSSSRFIFVVFPPDTFDIGRKKLRLSSSVIELAYSLGKGKKSVVLCGRKEVDCLPPNLSVLRADRIFTHEISNVRGVKTFFANEQFMDILHKRIFDET